VEEELKIEIQQYIKRSEDAIDTVKILIDHNKYSDAVSKAYYAMFYAASALLRTKNLDVSKHSGVISQFGLHFVKTGIIEKHHHKRFIKAFNDRDVADYRVMKEVIEQVAIQKLEDAKKFIESIKTFLIKESWL
jgi:uncharacterized protein (UPF0332 family)